MTLASHRAAGLHPCGARFDPAAAAHTTPSALREAVRPSRGRRALYHRAGLVAHERVVRLANLPELLLEALDVLGQVLGWLRRPA